MIKMKMSCELQIKLLWVFTSTGLGLLGIFCASIHGILK